MNILPAQNRQDLEGKKIVVFTCGRFCREYSILLAIFCEDYSFPCLYVISLFCATKNTNTHDVAFDEIKHHSKTTGIPRLLLVEISPEFGSLAIPSVKGILNLQFLVPFHMPLVVNNFFERFLTRLIYRRPQSHLDIFTYLSK
jgi:hypothetical protein